jgi:ketosteroid isomerase-like protein
MDAGTDKVVAALRSEIRGKASGAVVAFRFWQVITFRNEGKALRFEWFNDRAGALEAAGLSE